MLSPKQNRATLISVSFYGSTTIRSAVIRRWKPRTGEKLFRMFPWVRSVKTMYAEMAKVQQAINEIAVEMWVTLENLSNVGVRKLP